MMPAHRGTYYGATVDTVLSVLCNTPSTEEAVSNAVLSNWPTAIPDSERSASACRGNTATSVNVMTAAQRALSTLANPGCSAILASAASPVPIRN